MNALAISFVVALLALTVELILYLGMSAAYYRLGPTIWRREWEVRRAPGYVMSLLCDAFSASGMAWQTHGEKMLAFRRPWHECSTYPRMTLNVESVGDAARITWRVKLFVSPLLVLPLPLIDYVSRPTGGMNQWIRWAAIAVAAAYVYFFAWELPQLRKLDWLHQAVARMQPEEQQVVSDQ